MSLSYAYEKLGCAVHDLATGRGRIAERLQQAMISFLAVNPSDLPDDLKKRFLSVRNELSTVKATGDEGNLAATLRTMDEQRIAELAAEIVELDDAIAEVWRRGEAS